MLYVQHANTDIEMKLIVKLRQNVLTYGMVSTYLLGYKEHNKPSTNILNKPANHPNMNSFW